MAPPLTMISDDLKQAIVQLQLAALEKLARRQGVVVDRAALERSIVSHGIAEAYKTLHLAPPPTGQGRPIAHDPSERPAPPQIPMPATSLLRRLAQRWFRLP